MRMSPTMGIPSSILSIHALPLSVAFHLQNKNSNSPRTTTPTGAYCCAWVPMLSIIPVIDGNCAFQSWYSFANCGTTYVTRNTNMIRTTDTSNVGYTSETSNFFLNVNVRRWKLI